MLKRWPGRREFMFYFIILRLAETEGKNELNLGEIVDALKPLTGSQRLAARIARSLVKQGFLERTAPMRYRVRPLEELLAEAARRYAAGRLARRGLEVSLGDGRLTVSGATGEDCEAIKRVMRGLGTAVECYDSSSSSS